MKKYRFGIFVALFVSIFANFGDALMGEPAVAALPLMDCSVVAHISFQKKSGRFEGKRELERFQTLIGDWRGVGQPRRNSRKGAWIESTGWIWQFDKKKASLKMTAKDSKQLTSGVMKFDLKSKTYVLTGTLPDKSQRKYVEVPSKNEEADDEMKRIIFESAKDKKGKVHRLTVRILSDIRVVLLFESKRGTKGFYRQDGQIGYTRKGESIASSENTGPECVVSGGKGTIMVSYKGATYYVCCSGCKQAFEDDPEGIIADYLKKRKSGKKK